VLDEPTAGLDPQNERLVCEALEKLARGRTVLVISHREETISLSERVAEMVDGRIERVISSAEFLSSREAAP
jgi:ATP-binding cassette subfamily C protein CydD